MADEHPAAAAGRQAGVTWDRVSRPDPARDELEKDTADEDPAAAAEMQAGVTWDRVPRPDPA